MPTQIVTQKELGEKVEPKPGVVFIAEDGLYYQIIPRHPNLRQGEPGIKFTDTELPEGQENQYPEHFWAVIPLSAGQIEKLLRGHT